MRFNALVEPNLVAVRLRQSLGITVIGTVSGAFEHPALDRVDLHVMLRFLLSMSALRPDQPSSRSRSTIIKIARVPAVSRSRRMSDRMNAYSVSRGSIAGRCASELIVARARFAA